MAELDLKLAEWALGVAKKNGATAAEVLLVSGESLAAGVRLGEVEKLKSSRERRLGLRVFIGQSSATSSTAEIEAGLAQGFHQEHGRPREADRARSMVGASRCIATSEVVSGVGARRPHSIASSRRPRRWNWRASRRRRRSTAIRASRIPRARNSTPGTYRVIFANSQGFAGEYSGTNYHLGVAPIAQDDSGMQIGYWYTSNRMYQALDDPEQVGKKAAERALRKLGARKIKTTAFRSCSIRRWRRGWSIRWRARRPARRSIRELPF